MRKNHLSRYGGVGKPLVLFILLGGNSMSTVYRINDKIDLKIDDIIVSISPLNYKIKADMQSFVMAGKPMNAAVLALKNSVKAIKGLKNVDGSNYELEFEADGSMKESCVDDLLNIPESGKLNVIAISLINGMPQGEFMDPQSNTPMDGVKFVERAKPPRKK
jgi:hypothetical protein